jgi:phage terminase large subunit-like protein
LLHKTGEWSIVRIKTTKQGGLRLATATIGFAWFDEPPESPRIYSEITKRVMRAGRYGRVILTMTPINAPVAWIQKSVELGQIEDFHARMEPDQFLFVSRDDRGQWRRTEEPVTLLDGTKCDGEWIAAQIKGTLPHEVPVVCHGEWRMMAQRAVFGAFRESGPNAHVTPDTPDSRRVVHLYVGVDHGVREFTQVAVLVAVDRADPDAPIVWVLDEYVGEYETTDEDDAIGIDEMLRRNSIEWVHLDEINGDRAHLAGGNGPSVARKSNQRLAAAMCRHLGVGELRPPILPAKRGVSSRSGSVEFGCTVLHRLMVANRFRIHPRCKVGIASIQGYDLTPNSAESHWVDALRYALRPVIWTTKATNPIDVEVG